MGHIQAKDLAVEDPKEIERLVDLVTRSRIHELTTQIGSHRITITAGPHVRKPSIPKRAESIQKTQPESSFITPAAPKVHRVIAPMVGVFHHGDPPAASGMPVEAGQVIGVIESMKLMNDIRSEEDGIIQAVHIEDGLAVEYGQPLFDVLPTDESKE